MRKWLAIFAGVSVLVIAVVLMTCQYQTAGKEQKTASQKPSLPAASPPPHDGNSARQSCDCAPKTPCWFILLAWPEGLTAWAVILTFAVIGWQADETRKSAKATEKSVELSAAANTQWIKLKLLDMYSEVDPGHPDPPSVITLRCRWVILNPSTQPLTLHTVKVDVARDDAWHVCEFDFDEVVPPGEDGQIVIVPIRLGAEETAEYLKDGVEYSVAIHAVFTGINGRRSRQDWGDLFYFNKGQVEWNATVGKSPQREYDEPHEHEGTLVPTGREIYEFNDSIPRSKRKLVKKRD
jgi:hypothetical protein